MDVITVHPCFICPYMIVTTQLELCLHKQTQIAANVACRVVASNFLARLLATCFLTIYCDAYFIFKFFISTVQ